MCLKGRQSGFGNLQRTVLSLLAVLFLSASAAGQVGLPPIIIVQPLDQVAPKGGSVTFAVTATSVTSMSFKWFRNGTRIPAANSSTYTLTGLTTNHSGRYSVEVKNSVGATMSRAAVLVVTTNSVPVAVNDLFSGSEDTTLFIPAPGILSNDVGRLLDPNTSDPITPLLITAPTNGTVSLNSDGSFTFAPSTNFFGSATFTYAAVDSMFTGNVATVTITVTPVNDPPIARDDTAATAENNSVTIDVLSNDTDVDGPFTVSSATTTNGTVQISGGKVIFTPAPGFFGQTVFSYTISDGSATATANVTVVVSPAPPVANGDVYSTVENRLLVVPPPGVLANDIESHNGVPLTALLISGAANGSLNLAADGSFTYTPKQGYFGRDKFTYIASGVETSAPTTVVIDTALSTSLRFVSAEMTDAGFATTLSGPRQALYTIFTSTDQQSWIPIATNTAFDGKAQFIDSGAGVEPHRFYAARVHPQAITLVEQNVTGGSTLDVREGKEGAQSFRHGSTGDPAYTISRIVLRLSRGTLLANTNLAVSIGTLRNGGTVAASVTTIAPAAITNSSSGASFQEFDIRYSVPIGPFAAGAVYYLNLDCPAPNGGRIYVETAPGGSYANGTYYRGGANEGQDARFELWGQWVDESPVIVPASSETAE